MKIKIVLLTVYVVFVAIAILQWREAKSLLAVQMQAIEAYGRVTEKESAVVGTFTFEKLASAAQGEARLTSYLVEKNRLFVLLSLALTLPLAVYVGSSLGTKKTA